MRADTASPSRVSSDTASGPANSGAGRPRARSTRRRNLWLGLAFTSPWIIGLAAFSFAPVVVTLVWSFMKVRLVGTSEWVGLDNYTAIFADPRTSKAILNTALFLIVGLPLQLMLSFGAALLLKGLVSLRNVFRAIVYLPTVIPAVASVYLWRWMLNPKDGLFNLILGWFGIPPVTWLGEPMWSQTAVIVIILWGSGATVIIYLAALLAVPKELYEAAQIDGAGRWRRIWSIDWPSVRNVTSFQAVMGFIAFTQLFAQPFLLAQTRMAPTAAGPSDSLLTISMLIYQRAFVSTDFGGASAIAWLLFIVTLIGSILIVRRSDTEGSAR